MDEVDDDGEGEGSIVDVGVDAASFDRLRETVTC